MVLIFLCLGGVLAGAGVVWAVIARHRIPPAIVAEPRSLVRVLVSTDELSVAVERAADFERRTAARLDARLAGYVRLSDAARTAGAGSAVTPSRHGDGLARPA